MGLMWPIPNLQWNISAKFSTLTWTSISASKRCVTCTYPFEKYQIKQSLSSFTSIFQQVAISRMARNLLEDHFYFTIVVEKWVYGRGRSMLEHSHVPGVTPGIGLFNIKNYLRICRIVSAPIYTNLRPIIRIMICANECLFSVLEQ